MTKALVIVAHPDDEVIWMGGFLIRHNWEWTIVSLCRVNDIDREPRFRKICNKLNAASYMFDLDDSETGKYLKINYEDIANRLEKIKEKDFDYIFTHGNNGE